MNRRTCLMLLALVSLLTGACTIPSVSINVEPPAEEATTPPEEGITPLVMETGEPAPTAEPEAPTPTNTLVVPPASDATATPQPPAPAPTEETAAPPEPQQTPEPPPIPTAIVDPDLVALWNWALALEEEVAEPLEEMVEDLDELGVGSGAGDILAICTGVDVVLATLDEVQQGLDTVGQPPVDDPDLLLAYSELGLALNDLQEAFRLFQSFCQTMDPRAAQDALPYLESAVVHSDNAAAAIERWESSVGL